MIRPEVMMVVSAILIMLFAFAIMPAYNTWYPSSAVDTRSELPSWMLFLQERETFEEPPVTNVKVAPAMSVPNRDVSSTLGTTPGSVTGLLSSQVREGSSSVGDLVPYAGK